MTLLMLSFGLAACQTATTGTADPVYPASFKQTAAEDAAGRVAELVARTITRIDEIHPGPVDQDELRRLAAAYMVGGMQRGESESELARGAVAAMLETLDGDNEVIGLAETGGPDSTGNASVGLFEARADDGGWVITFIHPDGALAGTPVGPGWRLLEIDRRQRRSMERSEVIRLLRGPAGSPVQLGFQDVHGNRAAFGVRRVSYSAMDTVIGNCGQPAVVRVVRLTPRTPFRLRGILADCEPEELVLDLRSNAGGTLDALVGTAALFAGDAVIFRLRDKDGLHERRQAGAKGDHDGRLLVLTDRYTASGGEILAHALRQTAGALIAGETTAGHGNVHTVEHLQGDVYMKVLTGRFETETGGSPVPVRPDIEIRDDWMTPTDEVNRAVPALVARSGAS